MGKPVTVTDTSFDEMVIQSDTPVLVDFWADWCGPCKMIAPVLEELSGELDGKLVIGKLDVDENQSTAMAYGVMSTPAIVIDEKVVSTGRVPAKSQVIQMIRQAA